MKSTDQFVFFFGKEDPFSNWHPACFEYKEHVFENTEQFMMFAKAKLFGDHKVAEKILASPDPRKAKALGREVADFNESTWQEKRIAIVKTGCREKFLQNPSLLRSLIASQTSKSGQHRQLVEASPYDRIWGIGLSASDTRAQDPSQWKGQNLLGQALTQLRDDLLIRYENNTLPERAQNVMERAVSDLNRKHQSCNQEPAL